MVERLQTAAGEIKEYRTVYVVYGLEGPEKYATNCEQEECDHLVCAIHAAEYKTKQDKTFFKIFSIVGIFWFLVGFGPLGGFYVLFGIYNIWQSSKSAERAKELMEFRDLGTINGIKASQIFEYQEDARSKHWWQFWK